MLLGHNIDLPAANTQRLLDYLHLTLSIIMASLRHLNTHFRQSIWLNKSMVSCSLVDAANAIRRSFNTSNAVPFTSLECLKIRPSAAMKPWKSESNIERSFSSLSSILSAGDEQSNEDAKISRMTTEELEDTSSIPGWELVHNPPRRFPRGSFVGIVASDKMQKTVNVAVTRMRTVPKIRKRVRYTRKFMAHDENEVAKMGDTVLIVPCQKISKNKHFMLREIIKAKGQLYE